MPVLLDLYFIRRVIPHADIIGTCAEELSFSIDSRTIKPGNYFVALQGNRVDGHDFIIDALHNGAQGVVVDAHKKNMCAMLTHNFHNIVIIVVKNTAEFLYELARAWRKEFSSPVVGITGSIGKTSTKELLARIVAKAGKKCLVTEGNQNTALSCALLVLTLRACHDVAIFEMGISRRGEMALLASIVQPTTAVITALGHSHAEGLGSLADIFSEKRLIFSLFKEDSIGIINGDSPFLSSIAYKHPVIKFGCKTTNQIQARKVQIHGSFISCIIKIYEHKYQVTIPTHHMGRLYNILAAVSVAHLLGISHDSIVSAIQEPCVVQGRFEIKKLKQTQGLLINDCYNASPESMRAALVAFEALQAEGKKIAVLGDMLELGITTPYWHRHLGRLIGKTPSLSYVILVGKHVGWTTKTVPHGLNIEHVATWQDAAQRIQEIVEPQSAVLVKASRGMRLDLLVDSVAE